MEKERIFYLINTYKAGVISNEQLAELKNLIKNPEHKEMVVNGFYNEMMLTREEASPNYKWEILLESILNADKGEVIVKKSSGVFSLWIKLAAAAVFLGFVIWSLVFVLRQAQDDKGLRQAQTDPSINPGQDVKAPEVNRAMITLSDGRQVYLDQVGNGSLAKVSGMEVIKEADGKIVYRGSSSVNREMVYNTLTNPRGSRVIDITLSDGSRVWLNAGSSLRYPVVFGGVKREVELEGEGYFEVNSVNRHPDRNRESILKGEYENSKRTPGEKVPFYVRSGEVVTEVLGTHFNVNAYEDEGEIRVTLLEGSVSVNRENMNRESVKLVPGQSAVATNYAKATSVKKTAADEAIQVKRNVDIEEVMAWKNGVFKMNSADIGTIMRQVARWYDVEVVYESGMPKGTISGEVPRSLSLAKVLRVYEISGVNFTIEGKKVVVK